MTTIPRRRRCKASWTTPSWWRSPTSSGATWPGWRPPRRRSRRPSSFPSSSLICLQVYFFALDPECWDKHSFFIICKIIVQQWYIFEPVYHIQGTENHGKESCCSAHRARASLTWRRRWRRRPTTPPSSRCPAATWSASGWESPRSW